MGISDRRFCTGCGGHVLVEHPRLGFVDIPAAKLTGMPFEPKAHLNYAEAAADEGRAAEVGIFPPRSADRASWWTSSG